MALYKADIQISSEKKRKYTLILVNINNNAIGKSYQVLDKSKHVLYLHQTV